MLSGDNYIVLSAYYLLGKVSGHSLVPSQVMQLAE